VTCCRHWSTWALVTTSARSADRADPPDGNRHRPHRHHPAAYRRQQAARSADRVDSFIGRTRRRPDAAGAHPPVARTQSRRPAAGGRPLTCCIALPLGRRARARPRLVGMAADIPRYELNDGHSLPVVGFGTYPLRGDDGVAAMVSALEGGYRLLDTAVNYRNEEEVGEAIRRSAVATGRRAGHHEDPRRHHDEPLAIRRWRTRYAGCGWSIWTSASSTGQSPRREVCAGLAGAGETARARLVRSIGVSNFTTATLQDVIDDTVVAVNQMSCTPTSAVPHARRAHAQLAFSPNRGSPLGKRSAPFSQVRWYSAQAHRVSGAGDSALAPAVGCSPAKSATPPAAGEPRRVRIRVTDDEMAAITALGAPTGGCSAATRTQGRVTRLAASITVLLRRSGSGRPFPGDGRSAKVEATQSHRVPNRPDLGSEA
jgi:diketogulonate reductase-like aldo/keto reductase